MECALNRVSTAQTSGSTGSSCWGQSFGYDRFGNLLTATVTKCSAPSLNLTVNGNNQITNTGFQYDAAGNMMNDGSHAYTFDAENILSSGNSVTYTHDGDNWRVKKSNGGLEWHDTSCGGDLVDVFDLSGNLKSEYYYLGSILIATRSFFYYGDQLQSERVMTDTTGHVQWESDYYAYGGELNVTDLATNDRKFNSKRRDSETGFDYAHHRMLDAALGRWVSSDPQRGKPIQPETLNRYSYVLNNPANFKDRFGLAVSCDWNCVSNCMSSCFPQELVDLIDIYCPLACEIAYGDNFFAELLCVSECAAAIEAYGLLCEEACDHICCHNVPGGNGGGGKTGGGGKPGGGGGGGGKRGGGGSNHGGGGRNPRTIRKRAAASPRLTAPGRRAYE